MIAHLSQLSNRRLLLLTLSTDVLVFAGGGYLERVSLQAAADSSSTAAFITLLLFANFALLALVALGFTANGLLVSRVLRWLLEKPRYIKVERGEIEAERKSVSR